MKNILLNFQNTINFFWMSGFLSGLVTLESYQPSMSSEIRFLTMVYTFEIPIAMLNVVDPSQNWSWTPASDRLRPWYNKVMRLHSPLSGFLDQMTISRLPEVVGLLLKTGQFWQLRELSNV